MPWTKELWGGFVGNKLDMRHMDDGWGGSTNFRKVPALFTNYQDARHQYEDVRKVDLTELLNVSRKHSCR